MGNFIKSYKMVVGKCGRKRVLGRPKRRGEDNIKINLTEV
jgi:hypothetical protein